MFVLRGVVVKVGKRLISGVLSTILCLGGVSARHPFVRKSARKNSVSSSLTTGGKALVATGLTFFFSTVAKALIDEFRKSKTEYDEIRVVDVPQGMISNSVYHHGAEIQKKTSDVNNLVSQKSNKPVLDECLDKIRSLYGKIPEKLYAIDCRGLEYIENILATCEVCAKFSSRKHNVSYFEMEIKVSRDICLTIFKKVFTAIVNGNFGDKITYGNGGRCYAVFGVTDILDVQHDSNLINEILEDNLRPLVAILLGIKYEETGKDLVNEALRYLMLKFGVKLRSIVTNYRFGNSVDMEWC